MGNQTKTSFQKQNRQIGQVSLERALSKIGYCSRSEGRQHVLNGKVQVNGKTVLHPGHPVNPAKDHIALEGMRSPKNKPHVYLMLHKPDDCITTQRDEKGRRTIFDILPLQSRHIHAVGRLDRMSTGLLLLTSFTRFSEFLTNPKNRIPRTYEVFFSGPVSEAQRQSMLTGFEDGGEVLQASQVEILSSAPEGSALKITLHQGKNREIRRMAAAFGYQVPRLHRIAFGPLELGTFNPGECRRLRESEMQKLFPTIRWSEKEN